MKSRFSPPRRKWSATDNWVLSAAFGSSFPVPPRDQDPEELWRRASDMGVGYRIGAQWSSELGAQFGPQLARLFHQAANRVEAHCLRLDESVEVVANVLDDLEVQGVVLKGMALRLLGVTAAGARACGDLDLLVDARQAEECHSRLLSCGFTTVASPTAGHHLPPLADHRLGVVELHTTVPVMRVDQRPVTLDVLMSSATQIEGMPLYHPSVDMLAAHAVSHGWIQEGHHYGVPVIRMLFDLVDLARWVERHELKQGAGWLAEALEQIPGLSQRDGAAMIGLVGRWLASETRSRNIPVNPEDWPAPERDVVNHAIALLEDPDYVWSLKLRGWALDDVQAGSGMRWLRMIWPYREALNRRWPKSNGLAQRVRWWGHLTVSAVKFLYRWARVRGRGVLGRSA